MEMKVDKKSAGTSNSETERIASMVSDVISLVGDVVSEFDFKKKAELELVRRDVIKVASAQIQKMKDAAETEIEKINDRAAAERKVINDRAAAERKIVKDKLNAELKRFNDKVDAEIGKIDDILFKRRVGTVAKIATIATTSLAKSSSTIFGVPKNNKGKI